MNCSKLNQMFWKCQNSLISKNSAVLHVQQIASLRCSSSSLVQSSLNSLNTKDQLKQNGGSNVVGQMCHHLHTSSQVQRSSLDVIYNLKQLTSAPKMAVALGVAGLVPFAVSPYLMISSGVFDPSLAVYQNLYGATILSFLGGVRWGLTLPAGSSQSPDLGNLGYSVLPQLWACSALAAGYYMDCHVMANVGVTLGLAASGYMDMTMHGYPSWYKGLRLCLTLGAIVSMITVIAFTFILEEEKKEVQKDEE